MTDLIDTREIAEMLCLRHEYVRDRLVKSPDFPPPDLTLSQRLRKWRRDSVEAWLRSRSPAANRG